MRRTLLSLLLLWTVLTPASAHQRANHSDNKKSGTETVQLSKNDELGEDRFSQVRAFIQRRITELQVPSIAVAVARDGQIIWEEAFGWADRENRIPATPHTMYSLASISKPITATGLMILKERGKIDLDRPINDYLGEAKIKVRVGNPADATVRRVLNHTSGLPLHYQFFYVDEPYRRPSMDETILRYGNAVTAPGDRCNYSNLGYGVIDYVISRVSGKSYADFMKTEVFLPLGLAHMSVDIGLGLEKYQAVRYGTDGLPIPFYDFDHLGGSAIYASAHDLVRFGMFHLKAHLPDQKAIISDESIEEMHKPTADLAPGQGYGIGWITENRSGHHVVLHTGGMGGVSTILGLFPDDKVVIAVMTNSSSVLRVEAYEQILSVLIPDAARKVPAPAQEKVDPFTPPGEFIGTWKGSVHTYQRDVAFTLEFKQSGDVHAQLGSQLKTLVNNVTLKDGYLTGRMMGDIGTADANRRPYELVLSLKLRGDVLNGAITALSLPGKRVGNALSHWVELAREKLER